MGPRWSVAFLLCIHALLLGWLGWVTSPNRTEVGHMGATVYFWKTLRFDVFNVNPPLTRIVAGLPVGMSRPNYDWDYYSSRPQDRPLAPGSGPAAVARRLPSSMARAQHRCRGAPRPTSTEGRPSSWTRTV